VKKLSYVLPGLAVLAALAVVLGEALAADPSIKEVMKKAHAGADSLLAGIEKEAKGENPDWDTVKKGTKEMSDLGKFLIKNDPPQGSKESWEKQCKVYADIVAVLDAAAGNKDKKATTDAVGKLRASCGGCHGPHKPKK
jgi:cytochrome c556